MMKLGVTSIQRNRGKWIVEWLAFHMLMGFRHFYIYTHLCDDDTEAKLLKLARHYDIQVYRMGQQALPQLTAYQHAYDTHGADMDWMAFIDGDEFLQPAEGMEIATALSGFDGAPLSALAAYWICYGSNGHLQDPDGLVVKDYPRHSRHDFAGNHHVKSIVRGRQQIQVRGSHVFDTAHGTFDEQLRPVDRGWMNDLAPSHARLRINHYSVQSFEFFKRTKQNSGAPDGHAGLVRPDSWFFEFDRNECDDGSSYRFLVPLQLQMQTLQAVLDGA